MKVINTQSIPIKLWLNKIDSGAMAQARNLADFPFAFHHVAIMPDAHKGYGMPIGGVLATRDVVIPNAVGVDIGCGMVAVQTTVRNLQKAVVKQILDKLRQVVPVGFNHHKEAQAVHQMPWISQKLDIVQQEFENARKHLCTLCCGNHFIEIQKGDDGYIWLMVHSGSRNLGYKTAKYYNTLAKKKKKEYKNQIPAAWQLDYFPLHSQEAENYLAEMNYCIDFALANRRLMMERFMDIFAEFCEAPRVDFSTPINIAHNYAAREHHFGKKVVVHRKGATSAKKGEMGIIPGSQGDFSYIVEGKGNPESF
jgi:tRNA-splicing ligase RtcB